ncbi:hypothetical protein NC651_035804 [Populus alba x Populus x berolinensis]|nr:hypothetical protein NC651_035804 [Populus alba x Populus x berolinensis]
MITVENTIKFFFFLKTKLKSDKCHPS